MDLGIDISQLGRPGRRLADVEATFDRELDESDLEILATMPRGTEPVAIKKLTERHHSLAKALASGLRDGEAAALVGYDQAWVSSIKKSPAFIELMDLYRSQNDLQYAEFAGRLSGLGKDAVVELQRRLEDEPEKFSNSLLLEMTKTLADRSGHGPTQTTVSVNLDLGARLAAARERAKAAYRDITPPDAGRDQPPSTQLEGKAE